MKKITFEIEGQEYKLPNYISIENYSKIFKIKDLFVDEYFNAKLISTLSGVKVERLMEANYQDLIKLVRYVMTLFPKDSNKFYQTFEFEGVKYGFLPDWKDMSFGEFVDLDTLMTKRGNELYDSLHYITAILYRPITKQYDGGRYDIEKYDVDTMMERADKFKKLDAKYFLSAQFFFLLFVRKSRYPTLKSLVKKMTFWQKVKMIKMYYLMKWKGVSVDSLDGLGSLIDWQTMISPNTKKSRVKKS